MKLFVVKSKTRLRGRISFPGDKSIAHRAVILSSLAAGKTVIENFPANKDCLATVSVFRKLGVKIIRNGSTVTIFGKGLEGLRKPTGPIFVSESGTTLRLLMGVLSGQNFSAKLTAAESLSRRPMLRVATPLRLMGAIINSKLKIQDSRKEEYPPIVISGRNLKAITYRMPVASAQVKSAILLAGLYACGKTLVIEPMPTRDHTERMLKLFKSGVKVNGNKIVMRGKAELVSPGRIRIPGDISSASFFMVAASVIPGSNIELRNISLNPGRSGIVRVLRRMGADIRVSSSQPSAASEPAGDLIAKSSALKATRVSKKEIPSLIDELPVLMVAATQAKGRTVFSGVGELRIKESDRIKSMADNLKKMGACIKVSGRSGREDVIVSGPVQLKGARVKSFGDHRIAMSMVVAGQVAKGDTLIEDISCISKSFPGFLKALKALA